MQKIANIATYNRSLTVLNNLKTLVLSLSIFWTPYNNVVLPGSNATTVSEGRIASTYPEHS
jgi:hypothetical protein